MVARQHHVLQTWTVLPVTDEGHMVARQHRVLQTWTPEPCGAVSRPQRFACSCAGTTSACSNAGLADCLWRGAWGSTIPTDCDFDKVQLWQRQSGGSMH